MPKTGTKHALLLTTSLLVLVNLIPVVGVLFWDWSVYNLVLLFWAENLIVGGFNVARFWVLWRYRNDRQMVIMIPFFCLHFGLFMLVHLMFLIAMFRPDDAPVFPASALWLPFLALAVSHGVSFFTHFIGRGEFRTAKPDDLMTLPYSRVLVLQVTILVGGLLVTSLNQPLAALLVLVTAKILVDLAAHRREHRSAAQAPVAGEGSSRRDPDFPRWDAPDGKLGDDGAPAPETDQLVHALRGELHALEIEHERSRDQARREMIMIVAAALVLAIVLLVLADLPFSGALIIGMVLATVAALFRIQHWRERWQEKVHKQLLPVLCEHVGSMRFEPAMNRRFVLPFEKLELVSERWNRSRFGPHFHGRHAGTDFEFGQLALSRRTGGKNSSSEEIFNGLLFRIRLPFDVEDRLLVADKSTQSGMRHMVSVALDDPGFHETFAAHVAQDHVDPEGLARSVLDAEWRSALLAINRAESGGAGQHAAIEAAFLHDSLYLSLRRFSIEPVKQSGIYVQRPGRDFLQIPLKLFSEPDIESDLRALADDLLIAHRIVDQLPRPRLGLQGT